MTNESTAVADLDVLIVGAGLSGIGAACRLQMACPSKRFEILESRDAIGGTWDFFRYPGLRSDSDMFTLGYPFFPWREAKAIADGASILAYVRETARRFDVERRVRLRHRVVRAAWSSADARWTVDIEVGDERAPRRVRSRFLYLCCGYYSYDAAYAPEFPGIERFLGRVVHPQWWPEGLDYAGKRVVVIGSGATAVTLVPALAERAAHVVMLQRSPSYIISAPERDWVADALRAVLPIRVAHAVARAKNVLLSIAFYQFCRRFPRAAGRMLRKHVLEQLPKGAGAERHFDPRYDPWDQRLCLVRNADLFRGIAAGRVSVVTDTIDAFTERGLRVASGEHVDADVVVTATGLKVIAFGGIRLEVDGHALVPNELVTYKGLMLSGVPNLAWCMGYTNTSWTLRADLSSRYVCRLLKLMDRRRYDAAVPRADAAMERRPLVDLTSGYVTRAAGSMPKQGTKPPWLLKQNYLYDFVTMAWRRVDDDAMVFSRGPALPHGDAEAREIDRPPPSAQARARSATAPAASGQP